MKKSENQVLAELKQFVYDRNFIASTQMKGNNELEALLGDLSRKVIDACWDWFHTSSNVKDDDTRHRTIMRFCLTAGIGAAWLWENRREDVLSTGLFELMITPRCFRKMDEYIEDVTGIWYSKDSMDHQRLRCINHDCVALLRRNYDLQDLEQEYSAGRVICLLGVYCGYTRIYHDRTIAPHLGEYEYHDVIWESLYGKDPDNEAFEEWAFKSIESGKIGHTIDVITKDEDSEFGKQTVFVHSCVYGEQAGIKTLAYLNAQEQVEIMAATPLFETRRNYRLILDKVYVWKDGAEATIRAHFADDVDFEVSFYDTSYLENKDKYFAGREYVFDLYGIAYSAQEVPQEHRSITLEGEDAVSFNRKIGKETDKDDQGNPKPVFFDLRQLHFFLQANEKYPEDAEFNSPVKSFYNVVDFLGKDVYELEIGMPVHKYSGKERKHPLSVLVSKENFSEAPSVGTPINGSIYLQGKMRSVVNYNETPSEVLHTFPAKKGDGTDSIFEYTCQKEDIGQPLNDRECHYFAMRICLEQVKARICYGRNDDDPDLKSDRNRLFWVKADTEYAAKDSFLQEDKTNYLEWSYSSHWFPIIAYVTLYDLDGNKCRWLKGVSYKAEIHYGSVWPGQKMDIECILSHEALINKLYESFRDLDTSCVDRWLHKDLDFRSANLADPIITRDEYVLRTEIINANNRKSEEGQVMPTLHHSEDTGAYIKLSYPTGDPDYVRIRTENGFITEIKIDKKLIEL